MKAKVVRKNFKRKNLSNGVTNHSSLKRGQEKVEQLLNVHFCLSELKAKGYDDARSSLTSSLNIVKWAILSAWKTEARLNTSQEATEAKS